MFKNQKTGNSAGESQTKSSK